MKRIVLVRHAKPESGASSENPPLSEEGRDTHSRISEELKNQGIRPTKILSSPLLRAMQSAEIMAKEFGLDVQEEPILDGSRSAEEIVKEIQRTPDGESVFLVGHVPVMTELANRLGPEKVTEGVSKSGCVIFDFVTDIDFGKGQYVGYIHSN